MGQIVKLIELLARLDELDSEEIIYACEPWTADSDAMVALEDPRKGKPLAIAFNRDIQEVLGSARICNVEIP